MVFGDGLGNGDIYKPIYPDPRCHGNKIWDKIRYNSACVKDFCEIFAPIKRFSKMGYRMLPIAFFPTEQLEVKERIDKT